MSPLTHAGGQGAGAAAARILRRHRRAARRRAAARVARRSDRNGRSASSARWRRSTRRRCRRRRTCITSAHRYDELPAFLAGWDVALLPFAHNDATRFISPTKTLEYMAAGAADRVDADRATSQRLYGERRALRRHARRIHRGLRGGARRAAPPSASRALPRCAGSSSRRRGTKRRDDMRRIIDAASQRGLTEAARMMLEPAHPPKMSAPTPATSSGAPCVILGAGADRPVGRLPLRRRQRPARARGEGGRLVPLDRGYGLHVRSRRPRHVFRRPVRAGPLPAAARRQRPLAGTRSMDLQQRRPYALSVPRGSDRRRTAAGADSRWDRTHASVIRCVAGSRH